MSQMTMSEYFNRCTNTSQNTKRTVSRQMYFHLQAHTKCSNKKKHGHINDASPHPTCFKKDSFNIQEAFHLEDAFQTNPNRVKSSQVKGR